MDVIDAFLKLDYFLHFLVFHSTDLYVSDLSHFLFLTASKEVNLLESVPDLQKSMYVVIDGFPCVRLLNLTGEIGCSSRYSSSILH